MAVYSLLHIKSQPAFRGREAAQRACRAARKAVLKSSLQWLGWETRATCTPVVGTAHRSPVCLKPGDLQPPVPTPPWKALRGFLL